MTKSGKQIMAGVCKSVSIENLKKIVSSVGKNHISLVNQEALKCLQEKLSEDDYNSFINSVKE